LRKARGKSVSKYSPPEYTEDFERWWACYPRKADKRDAFKAWNQTECVRPADIVEKTCLLVDVEYRHRQLGYVPYPATFLRAERWDDTPVPPPVDHKKEKENMKKAEILGPGWDKY
jgi:hypothetical protein